MMRVITEDKELAKERFSLAEIATATDLVKTRTREHLRSIVYHNLERVHCLFKTALGVPILSLARDRAGLLKVITLRHDCVHRNGFDKDGKELTDFTMQFVQDTADLIKDFVTNIEVQLNGRAEQSAADRQV